MDLKDAITRVGCALGDDKFAQFTREQIKCALHMAQSAIFAARRDEFVKTIDVKLVPGAVQTIPEPYTEFVGLHEAPADNKPAISDNPAELARLNGRYKGFCLYKTENDGPYEVKAISASARDRRAFIVDPPAPEGVNKTVKVLVIAPPIPPESDCDPLCVGADYAQAVVEFAAYVVAGAQPESAYWVARSEAHLTNYWSMLKAGYNAEARVVSGYNLGLTGTGHERVGPSRDLMGITR